MNKLKVQKVGDSMCKREENVWNGYFEERGSKLIRKFRFCR